MLNVYARNSAMKHDMGRDGMRGVALVLASQPGIDREYKPSPLWKNQGEMAYYIIRPVYYIR